MRDVDTIYPTVMEAARKRIVRMRGRQLGLPELAINIMMELFTLWHDASDATIIGTIDDNYPGGWSAFCDRTLEEQK